MRRRGCPWAHAFRGFPKKFATVQRLCLSDSTNITALGAQAVCAACPGVRRAELPANVMDVFFVKDSAPAGLWQDLKRLTFRGLTTGTVPREFVRGSSHESPITSIYYKLHSVNLKRQTAQMLAVFGRVPCMNNCIVIVN